MNKIVLLLSLTALFSMQGLKAQTKLDSIIQPGLDKFTGRWRYINGSDTITMIAYTHYFLMPSSQYLKVLAVYYDYKTGGSFIHKNADNFPDLLKEDLGGVAPFGGASLDSLVIFGQDKLKRKRDEGILVISNNNNQLQFKRYIGITGGGVRFHEPGQAPLPGFTLPDNLIFTRISIPSEERGSNPKVVYEKNNLFINRPYQHIFYTNLRSNETG